MKKTNIKKSRSENSHVRRSPSTPVHPERPASNTRDERKGKERGNTGDETRAIGVIYNKQKNTSSAVVTVSYMLYAEMTARAFLQGGARAFQAMPSSTLRSFIYFIFPGRNLFLLIPTTTVLALQQKPSPWEAPSYTRQRKNKWEEKKETWARDGLLRRRKKEKKEKKKEKGPSKMETSFPNFAGQ